MPFLNGFKCGNVMMGIRPELHIVFYLVRPVSSVQTLIEYSSYKLHLIISYGKSHSSLYI